MGSDGALAVAIDRAVVHLPWVCSLWLGFGGAVLALLLAIGNNHFMHRTVSSRSRLMGAICVSVGGYVMGAMIGGPLIAAYSISKLSVEQLRDTLFVAWVVLTIGKLTAFTVAGVDL